jgi:uncharacterized membrane protein YiaA
MNPDSEKIIDAFITNFAVAVINPAIYLLFAVALVLFLWGVMQYIRGADDQTARKTGAQHMVWGLIGLAIMMSVFGIINVLTSTIGAPGL